MPEPQHYPRSNVASQVARASSASCPSRAQASGATGTPCDFELVRDRIDLSAIDADPNTPGDQAFAFVGTKPFSGDAGELRASSDLLAADVDGDGKADFQIAVDAAQDLAAANFLL